MRPTRLKICGITDGEDLRACRELGVDAVGVNLWPGSRRAVTVAEAHGILGPSRGGPLRIGVFVDPEPTWLVRLARELALDAVQLHGDRAAGPYAALGVPYIWVIRGTPALTELAIPQPDPLWVLLDAAVPGFGGAATTTDWGWAATALTHLSPLPVWLAGGIDPNNAVAAIQAVAPAGLDVASGSEAPGALPGTKDRGRIAALVAACRAPARLW